MNSSVYGSFINKYYGNGKICIAKHANSRKNHLACFELRMRIEERDIHRCSSPSYKGPIGPFTNESFFTEYCTTLQ